MTDATTQDLTKSVKAILKDADLDQLSAKKIRKMLEAEYETDFTERKEEIDKLVMQLITENEDEEEDTETRVKQNVANGTAKPSGISRSPNKDVVANSAKTNETIFEEDSDAGSEEDDDSDLGEIEDVVPKKKAKMQPNSTSKSKSQKQIDDEELAKQLQAEDGLRPSRRCKAQPVVRKQKKPRKEKAKGTSAYSRPCALLPPLDGLLDTDRMPRSMVVKRIWEIVKERDLFDPKNRQFMLCDEELMGLFGKRRIRMFGVMKHLKPYIKDLPKD